jgi:hypothetical protein
MWDMVQKPSKESNQTLESNSELTRTLSYFLVAVAQPFSMPGMMDTVLNIVSNTS